VLKPALRTRPFALLLLATLASACSSKENPASGEGASTAPTTPAPLVSATATAPSTATAPAADPSFTSAPGRYSVRFVGAPLEETRSDPKGATWYNAKAVIGAYNVEYADFANAKAAEASVTGYLTTMKNEIKEDKEVLVSGHKAHELRIPISQTAMMWMRIFTVDKRVYKVAAGTKNDEAKAMRFLDSFKLNDAPGATATADPAASGQPAAAAGSVAAGQIDKPASPASSVPGKKGSDPKTPAGSRAPDPPGPTAPRKPPSAQDAY